MLGAGTPGGRSLGRFSSMGHGWERDREKEKERERDKGGDRGRALAPIGAGEQQRGLMRSSLEMGGALDPLRDRPRGSVVQRLAATTRRPGGSAGGSLSSNGIAREEHPGHTHHGHGAMGTRLAMRRSVAGPEVTSASFHHNLGAAGEPPLSRGSAGSGLPGLAAAGLRLDLDEDDGHNYTAPPARTRTCGSCGGAGLDAAPLSPLGPGWDGEASLTGRVAGPGVRPEWQYSRTSRAADMGLARVWQELQAMQGS